MPRGERAATTMGPGLNACNGLTRREGHGAPGPTDPKRARRYRCWSAGPGAGSGRSLAQVTGGRAPFFAPFGPDLDASRCLSRRDLVVLNAVTSGNTFVEVGESKLHGGFCVKAGQGVFHLFRACFWSFPSIPFESPGKPENCVKRVSPCQECVNKRAW